MMRLAILMLSFWFSIYTSQAGTAGKGEVTILFIGNSYIYVNDLPGILSGIIDSARCDTVVLPEVRMMVVTRPGFTLEQHWKENGNQIEDSLKKAASEGDSVIMILQEQSQGALTPASRARMKEYATLFAGLGRKYNAEIILYQTWARRVTSDRYGEPRRTINQYMYQEVIDGDTTVLDESITSASKGICRTYRQLADELDARVAPCGEAFAEAIRQGIFVHQLDEVYGHHPNPLGSYLAASVMFGTIFGISPRCIPDDVYRYVWPSLARRLHSIADEAINGRLEP
jgi:hypothetical protein